MVMVEEKSAGHDDLTNIAAQWDDNHRFGPAPRHRRRLLLKMMAELNFKDCLDAGCAQLYLLKDIVVQYGAAGYGCDISDQVIASNRRLAPSCEFMTLDLEREVWPHGRQFDLVVCSEVLEHISDWRAALQNLAHMTRKHLLITVPSGTIYAIDRKVGHHYHFHGKELKDELAQLGFSVRQLRHWGFPFHSLYKILINRIAPDQIYESFAVARFGLSQRLLCQMLYGLFYLNGLFDSGNQLILLASKTGANS